jgi:hypothetical protein
MAIATRVSIMADLQPSNLLVVCDCERSIYTPFAAFKVAIISWHANAP